MEDKNPENVMEDANESIKENPQEQADKADAALSPDDVLRDIFKNIHLTDEEDFPRIELYMDQVTTFLNEQFEHSKRRDDDKLLTKTMINNYTKAKLIPPPVKKKYSKDHLIMLTFIYYFKNIISINDVKEIMTIFSEKYFGKKEEFSLSDVYRQYKAMETGKIDYLKKDVEKQLEVSKQTFLDAPDEDREFLQLSSFICMMTYDVYVKKTIIEEMIDRIVVPMKNDSD